MTQCTLKVRFFNQIKTSFISNTCEPQKALLKRWPYLVDGPSWAWQSRLHYCQPQSATLVSSTSLFIIWLQTRSLIVNWLTFYPDLKIYHHTEKKEKLSLHLGVDKLINEPMRGRTDSQEGNLIWRKQYSYISALTNKWACKLTDIKSLTTKIDTWIQDILKPKVNNFSCWLGVKIAKIFISGIISFKKWLF